MTLKDYRGGELQLGRVVRHRKAPGWYRVIGFNEKEGWVRIDNGFGRRWTKAEWLEIVR